MSKFEILNQEFKMENPLSETVNSDTIIYDVNDYVEVPLQDSKSRDNSLKAQGVNMQNWSFEQVKEYMRIQSEQKEREFEREVELLKLRAELGANNARSMPLRIDSIKMPLLFDNCDPQAVLLAFERQCKLRDIPKENWVLYLAPNLEGKALKAYSRLPEDSAREYEQVKAAILFAHELTPQQYRKKFRSIKKLPSENYTQMLWRMTESFDAWAKGASDFNALRNLCLLEQFEETISDDLKVWLIDQNEVDVQKVAELADRYVDTRSLKQAERKYEPKFEANKLRGGKPNHMFKDSPKPKPYVAAKQIPDSCTPFKPLGKPGVVCYSCGVPGHYKFQCPKVKITQSKESGKESGLFHIRLKNEKYSSQYLRTVKVNGRYVKSMRDTGASCSLLHRHFVHRNQFTGETVALRTLSGKIYNQPLAIVALERNGQTEKVEVAVAMNMETDFVIGNDIGEVLHTPIDVTEPSGKNNSGREVFSNGGGAYVFGGLINGRYCQVLKDTGSCVNIAREDMVHSHQFTGRTQEVVTIAGETLKLREANIPITDILGERKVRVLVIKELPYALLLGCYDGPKLTSVTQCYVITRAQAKLTDQSEDSKGRREREASHRPHYSETLEGKVRRRGSSSKRCDATPNTKDDGLEGEESKGRGKGKDVAWTGPHTIARKFNDINYGVAIDGDEENVRTYHINMLKEFKDRRPIVGFIRDITQEGEENVLKEPTLGKELSLEQKAQINALLKEFSDVLREVPGRTHLETHDVELEHDRAIAMKPYKVPWATREEIEKQVREMLNIIFNYIFDSIVQLYI